MFGSSATAISKGLESHKLKTRPGVSHGQWLGCLLPVALLVNVVRYPKWSTTDYKMTMVLSVGLLGQYQMYLRKLMRKTTKWQTALVGGLTALGTLAVVIAEGQRLSPATIAASISVLVFVMGYDGVVGGLLAKLPKSFTLGEANLVAQGLYLFLFNALVLHLPAALMSPIPLRDDPVHCLTVIIETGNVAILLLVAIINVTGGARFKNIFTFTMLLIPIILLIILCPVTVPVPILSIVEFIVADLERVCVLLIFTGFVGMTMAIVLWQLHRHGTTSTTVRKSFHVVICCVFLVGLLYQSAFLYVGCGVAVAIFILLETIRIVNVDHVGAIINNSVQAFIDSQDSGYVALTPFYLLMGCSLPLFLHPHAVSAYTDDASAAAGTLLPLLSGVISVGVGDMFAGVIGSKMGRHKWHGSKKSIEGSVANVMSQFMAIFTLNYCGFLRLVTPTQMGIAAFGIIINAGIEAKTDQVDNLVVPLVTFIIFSVI